MGDISEIRGLIVAGTFLAMTVLICGWIPSQFYTFTETKREIYVPAWFEASELLQYNQTFSINITDYSYIKDWGKANFGHNMRLLSATAFNWAYIKNEHHFLTFWGGFTGGHAMHWYNDEGVDRGETLYHNEIDSDFDESVNYAKYKVQCDHFHIYIYVTYNSSKYSNSLDVFLDKKMVVLCGITWDQMGTTTGVWNLVAGVLFFKLPMIDPHLNAILAVPIWICIAYIAFILVLRTIGAIFGGGGA